MCRNVNYMEPSCWRLIHSCTCDGGNVESKIGRVGVSRGNVLLEHKAHRHDNTFDCRTACVCVCVRCCTGVGEPVVLVLVPDWRLWWELMAGRLLSADLGPLQDRNHMTQQGSDTGQEEFVTLHWQKRSRCVKVDGERNTHVLWGAPAGLRSPAHKTLIKWCWN